MNTYVTDAGTTAQHGTREHASPQTFDHLMVGLAGVLFLTVASCASILITLPEALDAVSSPAMGAPWMTVSAPAVAPVRLGKDSARWSCDGH